MSAPQIRLVASHPLARWLAEFTFWLVIVALIVTLYASCSAMPATRGYVEERVVAIDEKVTEAAVDVAAPVDAIIPGYAQFVRGAYTERPIAPPPAEPAFPWLEVLGIVGAAFGVSVPAAVTATNRIRDGKRRQRAEAVTVAEARAKGYHLDSAESVV